MFLGPSESLLVIVASDFTPSQEEELLIILRENKKPIEWSISDIKGINPAIVQHRIHLVDDAKPLKESQRKLNPTLKEVVRNELLKCLDNETHHFVISSDIVHDREFQVINLLKQHKKTSNWSMEHVSGMSFILVQDHIFLVDNVSSVGVFQRCVDCVTGILVLLLCHFSLICIH